MSVISQIFPTSQADTPTGHQLKAFTLNIVIYIVHIKKYKLLRYGAALICDKKAETYECFPVL